jgi:isopentenyl-diphosphate delta-isomerase
LDATALGRAGACPPQQSYRTLDRVRAETVSFDDEHLILVDRSDRVTGYDSKVNAHAGSGLLHRAFSIFLFDGPDWVLLQQRSINKPLWPSYWANSCCSHPRRGESCDEAVHRRMEEELGASTALTRLYRFEYQAHYLDRGAEHELCTVYAGRYSRDRMLNTNTEEIQTWGWFTRTQVNAWIAAQPADFAPWFLLEWKHIQHFCRGELRRL